MKSKSKLYLVFAAMFLSLFLTACGGGLSDADINKAVTSARESGKTVEAAKADAKLSSAKNEMAKLAAETAYQGSFSSANNCNVLPQGFASTSAAQNFPTNAPTFYKDECSKVVVAMNGQRATAKKNAIVAERARVAKLAAAKQKAEEAKRVAAAKAKAKQHQKG